MKNRLDNYFDNLNSQKHWTGSVLITKENSTIYENNINVHSDARYCIASISKTFTGILTLKLIEDKKLTLESTVSEFLPKLMNIANTTIFELLTHTSGLPLIYNDKKFQTCMKQNKSVREILQEYELIEIIPKNRGKFNYINFDYMLLKEIIEVVSEVSYDTCLKSMLLDPLKLDNTGCPNKPAQELNLLPSYTITDGVIEKDQPLPFNSFIGAGNLFSTTEDLHILLNALKSEKVLKKECVTAALKAYGEAYNNWHYTLFNFTKKDENGSKIHFHEGGMAGFRSSYLMDSHDDLTIIVLSNINSVDVEEITLHIHQMIKSDV